MLLLNTYCFFVINFQKNGIFNVDLSNVNLINFNFLLILIILINLIQHAFHKKPNPIIWTNYLILLFLLEQIFNSTNNSVKNFIFNKTFLIDDFSNSFKILTLFFFFIFSLFFNSHKKTSFNYNKEKELYLYFLMILFFCLFTLESYDLISFFITIESSTFIIIALLFLQNFSNSSKEAGFKYFFLHALSSSCLILTIVLFIYIFKTTNYLTLLYYFLFSNIFFKIFFKYLFLKKILNIAIITLFFFFIF
jgi:NADH:ubiquinone oxidoreductase subunit 2 (subunit N)